MLTKEQSVWVVMQMSRLENPIMVKNEFKRFFKHEVNCPSEAMIRDIFRFFLETGSILDCSSKDEKPVPEVRVSKQLSATYNNGLNNNKIQLQPKKHQSKVMAVAPSPSPKEKIPPWQLTLAEQKMKRQQVNNQDKYAAVQEAFRITNKPLLALSRNSSISDLSDCSSVVTVLSRRNSDAFSDAKSRTSSQPESTCRTPVSSYDMNGGTQTYYIKLKRPLTPEDYDARLQMCEELRGQMIKDAAFAQNLFFSGEAVFHMSGRVTKHNCTIWGPEVPPESDNERESPKVVVWCGMSKDQVYGPFFFSEPEEREEHYTNMLRTFLLPLLRRRDRMATTVFQHDGAAAHLGPKVRQFLDDKFPKRWLGRRGLVKWAPWSPDLSPVDFYLWGEIKNQVYRSRSKSVAELRTKITSAANSIRLRSLEAAFQEWLKRVDYCLNNQGTLIHE